MTFTLCAVIGFRDAATGPLPTVFNPVIFAAIFGRTGNITLILSAAR